MEPIITSKSGQHICARHHIPLVTVPGYAVRGWNDPIHRVASFSSIGQMAVVEACNPNSVFPEQSLHRSKGYPERAMVTYCPKCEAAVQIAAAQPNPNRMPSIWTQIRTGIFITGR